MTFCLPSSNQQLGNISGERIMHWICGAWERLSAINANICAGHLSRLSRFIHNTANPGLQCSYITAFIELPLFNSHRMAIQLTLPAYTSISKYIIPTLPRWGDNHSCPIIPSFQRLTRGKILKISMWTKELCSFGSMNQEYGRTEHNLNPFYKTSQSLTSYILVFSSVTNPWIE